MKERPILFSSSMVLALLAGTKTQTRRVVKGDVVDVDRPEWWGPRRVVHLPRCQRCFCESVNDYETACGGFDCDADGHTKRSPYGAPGDRLWVRETWAWDGAKSKHVDYRATWKCSRDFPGVKCEHGPDRWRSPISMPRWASRISLDLLEVRIERLKDISEADAVAEGARHFPDLPSIHPYGRDPRWSCGAPTSTDECLGTARFAFGNLWESINGEGSWAANPWVWAIAFRRLP